MIPDALANLWGLALLALDITTIVVVLLRKRESSAALGWSLAVVVLPVLGALLFFCFGVTRLPRRLRRKVEHHAEFPTRLATTEAPDGETVPVELTRWTPALRMLEALDEPPVRSDNAFALLEQGQAAFERIFAAVAEARHHVHIEMYIFRYDKLGRRLLDLLVHKIAEGVEVRLLVDYVGSLARWRLLRPLRRAGGHGAVFLPLFPFGKRFVPNLRNHRKIVVCDGRTGFFGGLNVGEEYLGRKKLDRDWCDLHVEIRGPAVLDLQRLFVEDWDFATDTLPRGEAYFPPTEAAGDARVQILSGGPDREVNPIRQAWFFAITNAREKLYIASPYVVPDLALRDALTTAARLGVDVRVLTQSWPVDNVAAELAGSYYFEELLEAGVRIFRYRPGMMHAKLVLADDLVAAVGSANLDNRSMSLNFELMGVFSGPAEVEALAARFRAMLEVSAEIDLEEFRARPRLRRLGEGLARLLAPLM